VGRQKKWRPQCIAVKYSVRIFQWDLKLLQTNIIRFNPIQISDWLCELLEKGLFQSQGEMAKAFGLHRSRIGQFLALKKLPEEERKQLIQDERLREYQLRRRCMGE